MKTILRDSPNGHNFEKQNGVTQKDRRGHFDNYKCSGCGISGKCYDMRIILLDGRTADEKINTCPAWKPAAISRIKILKCEAVGRVFENLKPGSEHEVVEPPKPYKVDARGVWVMGVGEPVKVLNHEFIKL